MKAARYTSRSAVISLTDTVARQAIQFGFTIVLARLLAPAEFGVLAMLSIFIGLAGVMAEGGLGAALIQRQGSTPLEESSVFYFNAGVGLAMTLALAASAPLVASLYGEPRLMTITVAMSLNVLLNSLGSIHGALIVREGRLGLQLRIGLIVSVVSGGFGLLLALRGYGAWSLVGQSLCSSLLATTLLWTWHHWRPVMEFSGQALRPLLRYGGALMLCDLLEAVFGRLHTLLIGRLYGAAPLGLYMRASSTQQLPKMMLGSVIQKVTFPLLSSAAAECNNASILLAHTRGSLRAASILYIPAMFGLAATAKALVPFLFGPHWLPSVPILQVLCLAGALYPLHQVNLTLLKAMGHSSLFLRLEILKKAVLVALLMFAIPMGLLAVAWSQVAAGIVAALINGYYSKALIGYGVSSQLRDLTPPALVGGAMALIVWWQGNALPLPIGMTLLIQVSTGIIVYGAVCLGLGLVRRDEIRAVISQLFNGHAT